MRTAETDLSDRTHAAMFGYLLGVADELEREGNASVADVLRRYADREWQRYVAMRHELGYEVHLT
jgi:KaiC/GvpD/RAD55 family RecA-like ATPase